MSGAGGEPADVGDWVAFARDGRIRYARVEYVRYRTEVGALWSDWQVRILYTTEGCVAALDVLEIRRAP